MEDDGLQALAYQLELEHQQEELETVETEYKHFLQENRYEHTSNGFSA